MLILGIVLVVVYENLNMWNANSPNSIQLQTIHRQAESSTSRIFNTSQLQFHQRPKTLKTTTKHYNIPTYIILLKKF